MRTSKVDPLRVRHRSKLRSIALLFGCALCGAATYRVTFDILQIRGATAEARRIALDEQRTADDRRGGAVTLLFDAMETIKALRRISERGDGLGQQARDALAQIRRATD